jgi:hypothetical protein
MYSGFPFMPLLALLLVGACTVQLPQVNLIDEKTAFENQVLGHFEELSQDLALIESVRSAPAQPANSLAQPGATTPGTSSANSAFEEMKKQALQARLNQEYNQDDILAFKVKGWIGERNDGLLEIMAQPPVAPDAKSNRLLRDVLAEENQDRKVIMRYLLSLNPNFAESDLPKIQKILAHQNIKNARVGEWIQDESGQWQRKGTDQE